jgi:hypothetical protein
MSLEDALRYVNEGLILPGKGYRYINLKCQFGGNLSIQKRPEEKPPISFGHDEFIFVSTSSQTHHEEDHKASWQSSPKMKEMM